MEKIQPQWVLVNNELYHVSEFATLPPRERPLASCPVCLRPVTMKLGKKLAHHYAHQPDDLCVVSQPESALHYNVKFHIYKQLLNASQITTTDLCRNRCGVFLTEEWISGWDGVELEYSLGSYRLDIALFADNRVVGAIEIRVTHPVDDDKRQYFDEAKIPWIELSGSEAIYSGDDVWIPAKPLRVLHRQPEPKRMICDKCTERREAEAAQREYERNNYTEIHAAMMVDFYFPSGKKYREIYYVKKRVANDEWANAWVETNKGRKLGAISDNPITESKLQQLRKVVEKDIHGRHKSGAIVDNIIPWRKWIEGQKFVARAIDRWPFRYHWNARQSKWKKQQ